MKRTSLLCVLAVLLMVAMALPAWAAVEIFRVSVANPLGDPIPNAPAYINYTLNSKCDVTVEILPSDSAGTPTGALAIRTETLLAQAKGPHVYLWPCVDDFGAMATIGYYVARLTATNVGTAPDGTYRWDANIGLFKNWERPAPVSEWGYRDSADAVRLPSDTAGGTDETINGFYGCGVNHNPASPYYGRIYASHVTNKHVYMYDVDGTFLGRMNDDTITWMTSAPWDVSVASDGYVYVSDRTNMYVYCFAPDGAYVSRSGLTTNDRAIFASTAADGTTYLYVSSGSVIYQLTVGADHTSWTSRVNLGGYNGSDNIYGMWVSPDQLTMYLSSRGGSWSGLRKYTRTSATAGFTQDGTWSSLSGVPLADVEMGVDGTYLWAARSDGNASGMYKVAVSDGAQLANYNIVTWCLALDIDNVGNVLAAFGKATTTWGQKYLGMFAEPVATTKVVTTSVFYSPADPAPVVVPGSEQWTYSNPYSELVPNGSDTAQVSFKVLDANGYSDIGTVQIDLSALKLTSDPAKIVPPDTLDPDPSDPNGLTRVATKTVTCVGGVPYGNAGLTVTCQDADTAGQNGGVLNVFIAGNMMNTTISHVRTGAIIPGAVLRAVGGREGVPGYPFTFESPYTSDPVSGYVEMPIPQGTYQVTASRSGYKTQPAQTVDIPAVSAPYGNTTNLAAGVKLGALSVTEARAYTGQTLYASVEGLVYAHPKGRDGSSISGYTFVPGMDVRLDISVSPTENFFRHQWYMLDPTDTANNPGMQFQLKMTAAQGDTTSTFNRQWDDSTLKDPRSGNSLYLGKRPADGDTLCVAGYLETRSGYETRLLLDDAFLSNAGSAVYKQVYYNLTQYGIVPSQTLPAPIDTPLSGIYHPASGPLWRPSWGKFAQVSNVKVVKWRPDGNYAPPEGSTPADHNQFVVVVDSTGTWGTVTFQSLTSYGLTADVCPVNMGDTYTFKGAAGRRVRFGEGTLRARGSADIIHVSARTEGGSVNQVRGMSGGPVVVRGIVTAVFSDGFYVEASDRSVGVKCTPTPWWVNEGDDVIVSGNVIVAGIDKHIAVASNDPVIVLSSGNAKPELGMRTRDVGGRGIGPTDPGITNPRGPLNVGLYVTVTGMVTYRDSAGQSPAFYIWDGTNMVPPGGEAQPLFDGNAGGYKGLRIAHNGWVGAPYSRSLHQFQDYVTIKGIVGLDDTTVPGTVIPVIRPVAGGITPESSFDTVTAATGAVLNYAAATGGANLMSIPAVPAALGTGVEPDPMGAGTFYPWDPQVIFRSPDPLAPQDITDGGQASLYRYEDGNLTQYLYDVWAPDAFGGMNPSDGYWVYLMQAPWQLSFSGKYQSIPQWYAVENSVPEAAYLWIGQPHNYDSELENVQLSDGSAVYSFRDASQHDDGLKLQWVNSTGFWWNNQEGTQYDVGLWDDWASQTALQPWRGYLFTMNQGNKAWIIP